MILRDLIDDYFEGSGGSRILDQGGQA